MENEVLIYIVGFGALVSGVTCIVSSYKLNKTIKEIYRKTSEIPQQKKTNKLENITDSTPLN